MNEDRETKWVKSLNVPWVLVQLVRAGAVDDVQALRNGISLGLK